MNSYRSHARQSVVDVTDAVNVVDVTDAVNAVNAVHRLATVATMGKFPSAACLKTLSDNRRKPRRQSADGFLA
ncbi:MAG: hypothetical protein NXI32_30665 [bacterium]|nr:hypothetical protein [bacterium]